MSVTVIGAKDAADFVKKFASQVRFGMSLAIEESANYAQDAIKAQVPRSFTLRRPDFVRNTVVRLRARGDFATKRNLAAAIRIDDRVDSKGRTRNYLAKFVEGGPKRPVSGSSIAVPVNAKRNAAGIITNANRPRALMGKKGYERITTDRGKDLLVRFGGRGARARVTVLYALTPGVPIRAQFPMYQVAGRAVSESWPTAVDNGIERALASAK